MSKELLKKVIDDIAKKEAELKDEDFVRGVLSEDMTHGIIQDLPIEPTITVYREFKPMRDALEYTIYGRHTEYGKFRIDFEVKSERFDKWGDNAEEILGHLTRRYIEDYLPELKEFRERANG